MSYFRENYFIAREIVADELKQKYNLIESFKEYECLTLNSKTNSIHLTFIIPDGDEVYMSEKGKEWHTGKSFKDFLYETYPEDSERTEAIKQIFQENLRDPFSYEIEEIKSSFKAKFNFLENLVSEKFS